MWRMALERLNDTLFLESLLSYENEIYSSLIQKHDVIEQSQLSRNLGEKDPLA